ncbi:serine protease [Allomyces javanicus]|nr:serine protease [Allomyces javanicus]
MFAFSLAWMPAVVAVLWALSLAHNRAAALPALMQAADRSTGASTGAPAPDASGFDPIPDAYIITLKRGCDVNDFQTNVSRTLYEINLQQLSIAAENPDAHVVMSNFDRTFDLGPAFRGLAGTLAPDALPRIQRHPNVSAIEPVVRVALATTFDAVTATPVPTAPVTPQDAAAAVAPGRLQVNAPWHLARISQRQRSVVQPYSYPRSAGAGVRAYILDTGVNTQHPQLEGRAALGGVFCASCTGVTTAIDDHGHGSHVAGIVASKTYGVAKRATVVAVKILDRDGAGNTADLISGLNYVVQQQKFLNSRSGTPPVRGVANLSIAGPVSAAVNAAVAAVVAAGVPVIAAAGNANGDSACNYSPSGAAPAITVGATSLSDTRAAFSNTGPCTTMFAPGVAVTSLWLGSGTRTMSGTSMASPAVAGIAALVLTSHPSWTPAQVRAHLTTTATSGVVANAGEGAPNLLAFSDANVSG